MKSKNPGLQAVSAGFTAARAGSSVHEESKPKRRPTQPDDVPMSIRLPKPMHKQLKKLAYDNEVPIHGMILEGIALFLRSKGVENVSSI